MKFLFSTLILISTFTFCNAKETKLTVFEQLANVNKYWLQFNPDIKELQEQKQFTSENEKIKTHLLYVENYLRTNSINKLSAKQQQKRLAILDILHKYALAEKFPQNTNHPNQRVPYFIDKFNTPCAVGHLIIESGFKNVALEIHNNNNYGYIENLVKEYPSIINWGIEFGFAVDELAWIQPTYNNCAEVHTEPFTLSDTSYIVHPSCHGKSDGAIFVDSTLFASIPKPWTIVLSKEISTVYNDSTFMFTNGLSSGIYYVTVYNSVNIMQLVYVLINPPPYFTPIVSSNIAGCNPTAGSIILDTAIGANYPLSISAFKDSFFCNGGFLFDYNLPQSYTNTIDSLPFGEYTVIASDANGCKGTATVIVADSSATATYKILSPINCIDSIATVEVKTVANIFNGTSFAQTFNYDTLYFGAGNYTITSANSFGCSASQTINLSQNPWDINIGGNYSVGCATGFVNGSVNVINLPQQFNYLYAPFLGTGQHNFIAGNNQVIVSDRFGCADTINVSVPINQINSNLNIKQNCDGDSSYINFSLTNNGSLNFSNWDLLAPGTYTLLYNDYHGCAISDTFIITQMPPISHNINVTPASCYGGNGEVIISFNNFTGTFFSNYINSSSGLYVNGPNLPAGTYYVNSYATSQAVCHKIDTVTITQPPAISTNINVLPATCNGTNGAIIFTVNNNQGNITSNYVNGAALPAGVYTLSITDSMGCQNSQNFTIIEPTPININNIIATQVGNGFSINANITGGSGGVYTIVISQLDNGVYTTIASTNSFPITVPSNGQFIITATDSNGCNANISFTANYATNVQNNSISTIKIYPNPFVNSFEINNINTQNIGKDAIITDAVGKIIFKEKITHSNLKVELNAPAGIYILNIGNMVFKLNKQ